MWGKKFAGICLPSKIVRSPISVACPVLALVRTSSIVAKGTKTKGYWKSVETQRAYLDSLKAELGIQKHTDWYQVSEKDVLKRGGKGLLSYYPSLGEALQRLYPEHQWQLDRFESPKISSRLPSGYWKDEDNMLAFLREAEARLGIQHAEDWYSVKISDLRELGAPYISRPEFISLLVKKYPNYHWDTTKLLRGKFLQQNHLAKLVSTVFPECEIKVNVRKEAKLLNSETGSYLELDIYIPSLQLAFEYQDIHHYKSVWWAHDSLAKYELRDELKTKLVQERNITLVVVPCWWDRQRDSLIATIKKLRPDLLTDYESTAEPIPLEPPSHFVAAHLQKGDIQDIGDPVTATHLTRTGVDPKGWWMFEKYDGVRAFWNPLKRAFFSRQGNQLTMPMDIVDAMPGDLFLDGELWFGRERFEETMKIPKRAAFSSIDWANFRYMVFDIPRNLGSYAERYEILVKNLSGERRPNFLEIAPYTECENELQLDARFQDIIDKGGEGIILRDPASPYEPGRSRGYIKHKKFRDAEARIVRQVGIHQWECQLPNGVTFLAGSVTNEFLRRWEPKEGDVVSFKHRGFLLASKKPKFATLYRMRSDLTWDDVVSAWTEQKPRKATVPSLPRRENTQKPRGYWLNAVNRREVLCRVANSLGFDPSDVQSWSKVKTSIIVKQNPAIKSLLKNYGWKLLAALQDTFTELDWTTVKEKRKPIRHWRSRENCIKFFKEFAMEHGFDPMRPENWYNVRLQQLLGRKGGYNIKEQHGGFKNALHFAFPDLSFAKWGLPNG